MISAPSTEASREQAHCRPDPQPLSALRSRQRLRVSRRVLQLEPGVSDVSQPLFRIALQASAQNACEHRRRIRRNRRPVHGAFHHGRDRVRRSRSGKGGTTDEHFVDDATERPDVGAAIDLLPSGLLGAHVRHRARNGALLSLEGRRQQIRVRAAYAPCRLGETKIEHLHDAIRRQLDVGRLEVAMDDALVVDDLECSGHLAGDTYDF